MSYDVKGRKRVNGVKISILRSDVFFTCFPFVFQTVVCLHVLPLCVPDCGLPSHASPLCSRLWSAFTCFRFVFQTVVCLHMLPFVFQTVVCLHMLPLCVPDCGLPPQNGRDGEGVCSAAQLHPHQDHSPQSPHQQRIHAVSTTLSRTIQQRVEVFQWSTRTCFTFNK